MKPEGLSPIQEAVYKLLPQSYEEVASQYNGQSFYVPVQKWATGPLRNNVGVFCECGLVGVFPPADMEFVIPKGTMNPSHVTPALICPNCGKALRPNAYSFSDIHIIKEALLDGDNLCVGYAEVSIFEKKYQVSFKSMPLGGYLKENERFHQYSIRVSYFYKSTRLLREQLQAKYKHTGYEQFKLTLQKIDPRAYYGAVDDDSAIRYLIAYAENPHIELLVKAGFVIPVKDFVYANTTTGPKAFRACFKPGRNLREIIQMPEAMAKKIKGLGLQEFNEWRIFIKKFNPSLETFQRIIEENLNEKELKLFKKLLNTGYYSADTLMNYLERCQTYQAIEFKDSLTLLNDYIRMSMEMGVEPLTKTNSLKREHDVMARNYTVSITPELIAAYEKRVEVLKQYEYSNKQYVIIAPKSINEVIDEGIKQSNCLKSYGKSVAEGVTSVFFLRHAKSPDKPFASIELDIYTLTVLQKEYRGGQKITDLPVLDFIDEWIAYLEMRELKSA